MDRTRNQYWTGWTDDTNHSYSCHNNLNQHSHYKALV